MRLARISACHDGEVTRKSGPSSGISELASYPVTAPPLPAPVILEQRWRDLTFVHWPLPPNSVAHMYPPGTRPDVFADGMTYVALVPFAASGSSIGSLIPIPYFGAFPETNIR